jgi:hypothetical protein
VLTIEQIYAEVLHTLEHDPLANLVSPPLTASMGVIPLSIISVYAPPLTVLGIGLICNLASLTLYDIMPTVLFRLRKKFFSPQVIYSKKKSNELIDTCLCLAD